MCPMQSRQPTLQHVEYPAITTMVTIIAADYFMTRSEGGRLGWLMNELRFAWFVVASYSERGSV